MPVVGEEVLIEIGEKQLKGYLHIPKTAKGIVLFAHGSGSGRHSPRNQFVANFLFDENIATLLVDLMTDEEEAIDHMSRTIRFNIPLLAERLVGITNWISEDKRASHLTIGYFGASTGAAAALIAAAELGFTIRAIVTRGGRPDLAGSALQKVSVPTLLIVGGHDFGVIELNEQALSILPGIKRLEIVPGATHLFEEHGTLEEVARLASHWFTEYL